MLKFRRFWIFLFFALLRSSMALPFALPEPDPIRTVNIIPLSTFSDGPRVARIFEVDSANQITREYLDISENSEVVLKDVERIRLECTTTSHPVQWVYQGHGAPVLTSSVNFTGSETGYENEPVEFVASTLLDPVREFHTGKYICTSTDTDNFDSETFFYIYAPGPTLFSARNVEDIFIDSEDSKVLFPCSVSNPEATVTLEKLVEGQYEAVKPILWSYDQKEGATLDISQMDDNFEGLYRCKARYNNIEGRMDFVLQYPSPEVIPESEENEGNQVTTITNSQQCTLTCGENAHCEHRSNVKMECVCDHRFKGDPKFGCTHLCEMHKDCPQGTVCFRDLKCRDPCKVSIKCGEGAMCKLEKTFPVCYCPENYEGDPKVGCVSSLQDDGLQELVGAGPSYVNGSGVQCSRKCGKDAHCILVKGKERCECNPGVECEIPCKIHDDCPEERSCNILGRCQDPCKSNARCKSGDKCKVLNHIPKCIPGDYCWFCGANTKCIVSKDPSQKSVCSCLDGFDGDPMLGCKPIIK